MFEKTRVNKFDRKKLQASKEIKKSQKPVANLKNLCEP